MTRQLRKRLILIGIAVLVIVLIFIGFLPDPVNVEMAEVARGPLQVTVEEEGRTEVTDTYVITAPIAAYARRIELREGDKIAQGQPVVQLEPPRSAILDPRTRAEAEARVRAAEASLRQAEENQRAAQATARRAADERARIERLFEGEAATEQMRDQAVAEAVQAEAALEAAQAVVEAARAELAAARANLAGDTAVANTPVRQVLTSPVTGRVLRIVRQSEGMVAPGEPLVEIGDVENLEVRVEVLSQDAVRIKPGSQVLLDQWGGDELLEAVVQRVEPIGVTRISSLGVEEQRVTVVSNITSPPDRWQALGSGYRVVARFILWESDDALQVPAGALFRTDDGWAVFVVEDGRAVRRDVEIGHQSGLAAEVVSGLSEGDQVIVHPPSDLEEGARVE
jgi:HlyD family secretion protein